MIEAAPCSTARDACLSAHIGANPTRTDGVHANTSRGELSGEKTRQRVQAGLGHPVGGFGPAGLPVVSVFMLSTKELISSTRRSRLMAGLRNSARRRSGKPESSPAPLETMTMLPPAESG